MPKPEIAKNTLSDQVYTWMRQQIISGQIKQGEHLSEQAVSETLGVSATPVREALRLLNGDGLVELEGRRGARVIEPTTVDIRACFQVRRALECLALREACQRLSAKDMEQLTRIHQLLERAELTAPGGFMDADRAFHGFFLERARNSWLEQFLSTLTDFLYVVRQPLLQTSTLESARQEHLAITRAVLDGRIDEAERLLGRHIDRVCEDVIRQREQAAQRKANEAVPAGALAK
ncbi:GntR family transcriptional regulator [Ramlibacter henchirensis]|uniref:GntR family transcriptional regulator n=1 Tax=Ramlibacter henchirensis TaxID=204072 RepID=A0A4Z0BVA2_9BURK|nr:GntR family transcriptional regulator [Ramlibacter henchirensis]TFZ02771.1 GntR family transcriptional regulator [Ramlibacter henchirensis]